MWDSGTQVCGYAGMPGHRDAGTWDSGMWDSGTWDAGTPGHGTRGSDNASINVKPEEGGTPGICGAFDF